MNKTASKYLGNVYPTNSEGDVLVVGYEGYKKVLVKFSDGTQTYCRAADLLNGEVWNPNRPRLYGVGFFGQGPHIHGGKRAKREYRCWRSMMERCYSERYQQQKPTYGECSVDTQWANFQEFAEWCQWQVGFDKGWHLDKDILIKGNKIYSPDACVFVPNEVNCVINMQKSTRGLLPVGVTYAQQGKYRAQWQEGGVQRYSPVMSDPMKCFKIYKENKERVVKNLAEKWKGLIDDRVYYSLMSFEVLVDD